MRKIILVAHVFAVALRRAVQRNASFELPEAIGHAVLVDGHEKCLLFGIEPRGVWAGSHAAIARAIRARFAHVTHEIAAYFDGTAAARRRGRATAARCGRATAAARRHRSAAAARSCRATPIATRPLPAGARTGRGGCGTSSAAGILFFGIVAQVADGAGAGAEYDGECGCSKKGTRLHSRRLYGKSVPNRYEEMGNAAV